ncbi:carbohydrate-binding domain-containing protein [uncultured Adlercreutzia sp.]|uniref:carbohydrate-binding domain-containing protein n=1 Tax=uncultured Adlercreutzia sp. TaxID=875803 RepID=UPI0026F3E15F|nr:carbohydrate-binding domain-containing protein [uncultured Adlercreutzia sp.]
MKKSTFKGSRRFLARGVVASALAASLALTGCNGGTFEDASNEPSAAEQQGEADGAESADWDGDWASLIDIAGMDFDYSDRDNDPSYDAASATAVTLSGESATVAGEGAVVEGSTVTITAAGTYVVSGELAGTLVVNASDQDKVQIVLDGASIRNEAGPALNIQQADKVFVTLAANSQNTLADGGAYDLAEGEDEPNAALFSKDDLTINGEGALAIEGNYRHGVNSKDDLVITGGTLTVAAVEDGLRGKDCVKVADGTFAITAGGDGVKSSNDSDPTRGFVAIDGGTWAVNAGDEGFQAATYLRLTGGEAQVQAGDHALRSDVEAAMTGGSYTVEAVGKGMNAETKFTMDGGTLTVTGCDEGIEAQEVIVNDGVVDIVASDDGINAAVAERASNDNETDAAAESTSSDAQGAEAGQMPEGAEPGQMPEGADGEPPALPEGMEEGQMPEGMEEPPTAPEGEMPAMPNGDGTEGTGEDGGFRGGKGGGSRGDMNGERPEMPEGMEEGAMPDGAPEGEMPEGDEGFRGDFGGKGGGAGMGAGGPMGANASEDCLIQINGGTVSVLAGGDAIDSNGYVEVTGGELLGTSTGNGDSALDYEYGATVTGGTVVLAGAAGMAETFSEGSTQPFALVNASGQAGATITVTDEAGKTLAAYEAPGAFQSIVVSVPGAADGATVTVDVNGTATQATLSTTPSAAGPGAMGGGMGGRGGDPRTDQGQEASASADAGRFEPEAEMTA